MEHLLGCHGEWLIIAQVAATLPFIGVWVKSWLNARNHDSHE
jgi:hypothetical protein